MDRLLRLRGVSVRAGFGFFAMLALTVYFGFGAADFLAAAAVHEAGHIAAMLLLAQGGMEIEFRAAGIYIHPCYRRPPTAAAQSMILLCGPAAGLAAALLLKSRAPGFFEVGAALSAANLIPVRGTDGGSLLRLWLTEERCGRAADYIGFASACAAAAAAVLPALGGGGANWLLPAAAAALFLRGLFCGE